MPPWLLDLAKTKADNDNGSIAHDCETTEYGRAWYKDVEALAKTSEGRRNSLCNEVACKAGSLIAGGQLSTRDARKALIQACRDNGLIRDDGINLVIGTINSGLERGLLSPRGPLEETKARPSTNLALIAGVGHQAERNRLALERCLGERQADDPRE